MKKGKLSYSEERNARRQTELEIFQAKKDKNLPDWNTSLCCHATIVTLEQPNAMENEVSRIRVCTACKTEAPKQWMFNNIFKIAQFYIDLKAHKTNNQ